MMNSDKRFSGLLGGGEYDLLKEALYFYDDLQRSVANVVSEETKEDKKYSVLEIGVGSGITTAFVLDGLKEPKNVSIFAIDNEDKMLDEAKIRFSDAENVQFINADIMEYLKTIPDEFFDGCYTGYVIHNFDFQLRKDLFKELGRVTKKGGFFVSADKIVVNDPQEQEEILNKEIALYENLVKIGRSEIKEEWIKHYAEDELIKFTESEQQKLLEENGFSGVNFIFRELMAAVVVAKKTI